MNWLRGMTLVLWLLLLGITIAAGGCDRRETNGKEEVRPPVFRARYFDHFEQVFVSIEDASGKRLPFPEPGSPEWTRGRDQLLAETPPPKLLEISPTLEPDGGGYHVTLVMKFQHRPWNPPIDADTAEELTINVFPLGDDDRVGERPEFGDGAEVLKGHSSHRTRPLALGRRYRIVIATFAKVFTRSGIITDGIYLHGELDVDLRNMKRAEVPR